LGYNTNKLKELLLSPLKKLYIRENPFISSSSYYPVVSSNKEDIPRKVKKKDKGKATKREDKREGFDTKKKKPTKCEESLVNKKKKRDESLVSINVRYSLRKKPA
jgi:hypothetical protein